MTDEDGTSERFQTTLSPEMMNFLRALAKRRTHGRTVPAVGRALIEAGVRQAIIDKFISIEDGISE